MQPALDDVDVTGGPDGVDPARFRRAMGAFATGVTVVTVRRDGDSGGALHGMTVNAFSSVSLDPTLLLVCLGTSGRGHELIDAAGAFCVNVLADDQQHLSRWFADRHRPADSSMFDGVPFTIGATGCPVILGAAASFDCRVHQLVPAGDHVIVIGEVVSLTHRDAAEPLVFHAGGYRALSDDERTRPQLRAV